MAWRLFIFWRHAPDVQSSSDAPRWSSIPQILLETKRQWTGPSLSVVRLNFGDKPAPDIAAAAIKNLTKALEAQHSEGAKEICTHVYVEDIGGSRENEARCKKVTRLVKSTPYSQQDNFKSKHGIQTTRTLTSQMRNVQIFLVINGLKFSTRFPLRRVKS